MNKNNYKLFKNKYIRLKNLKKCIKHSIIKSIIHNSQSILITRALANFYKLKIKTKTNYERCIWTNRTRYTNKNFNFSRQIINKLASNNLLLNYQNISW